MAYGLRRLVAALECAERLREAVAAAAAAALCPDRRAPVEDQRSRPSRAAVPGVARASRHGLAVAAVVLGTAEPAGDQPRCPHGKVRRRGFDPAAHQSCFAPPRESGDPVLGPWI